MLLVTCAACGGGSSSSGSVGAGGDRKAGAQGLQHREIDVNGVGRRYRLFVPPTVDGKKAAPLTLVLHGAGNDVESTAKTTQFERIASSEDFIVAYPEGLNRYWNGGFCCGSASADGVDDVAFLAAVIAEVKAGYAVDAARISMVGVSNGGIMAYRFGCERAELVTAIVSVAGAMRLEQCRPARPVSLLEIHGTADRSVPFNGGAVQPRSALAKEPVPSTTAVVEHWAAANGCPSTPETRNDGPVVATTWNNCRASTTVQLLAIGGAGHTWFAPGLGPANGAIDATTVITAFLGRLQPAR